MTVDNAQSHVTAFRPISEAARSWSDDNKVRRKPVQNRAISQDVVVDGIESGGGVSLETETRDPCHPIALMR